MSLFPSTIDTTKSFFNNRVLPPDKTSRILTIFAFSSILVLALLLAFREIDSPDVGLHLAPGRWMLSNMAFPSTDLFTYGAAGHSFVDLYWLYQVTLAVSDRLAGTLGMVLFNAAAIVLTLLVLFRRLHFRPAIPLVFSLTMLFLVTLTLNYELRPQAISWVYLGLLLLLWDRYAQDNRQPLWPSLLIMVLWVNTQPTFVLGWVVGFAYAAGLSLEKKRVDRNAIQLVALSVAVCLVNPYFFRALLVPFTQFGFLQANDVFKNLIAEYSSLPFIPSAADFNYFGRFSPLRVILILQVFRIAITVIFALLLLAKKLRYHEIIIFCAFFYLNSLAEKNIGYFIVAVVPMMSALFGARASNPQRGKPASIRRLLAAFTRKMSDVLDRTPVIRGYLVFLAVLSCGLGASVTTNAFYIGQRLSNHFGHRYNDLFVPVHATQFLLENGLTGRILNDIDFGGYFENNLPQKIYIDARNEVVGDALAHEYLKTYSASGLVELVRAYKPDIIAFPHRDAGSWMAFCADDTTNWRLVYFDELAAVYLRSGYAEHIPRITGEKLTKVGREVLTKRTDEILTREFREGFAASFIRKQYFPFKESELSAFCDDNAWDLSAIDHALDGIERSTVDCPELYFNLASYLYKIGDPERSRRCLEKANREGFSVP